MEEVSNQPGIKVIHQPAQFTFPILIFHNTCSIICIPVKLFCLPPSFHIPDFPPLSLPGTLFSPHPQPIQNALILQSRVKSTAPHRTKFPCLQNCKHFSPCCLSSTDIRPQALPSLTSPPTMLSEPKHTVSKRDCLVCTSCADGTNEHSAPTEGDHCGLGTKKCGSGPKLPRTAQLKSEPPTLCSRHCAFGL